MMKPQALRFAQRFLLLLQTLQRFDETKATLSQDAFDFSIFSLA